MSRRSRRTGPSPPPPQGAGRRERHDHFPSALLGNARTIEVYLPPGYESESERFPVLYLHDGQNLFDPEAAAHGQVWQADRIADRLIRAGRIPPLLLVGIANTPERMDEYATVCDQDEQAGGRGQLYARFVFEEVKPFIDRTYRTRPERQHVGVAGSSLGGLISLEMARWHADQFALCGALSPSLWWADEAILSELEGERPWTERMRFWVDMGTREGPGRGPVPRSLRQTRHLIDHFDRMGLLPGHDYCYWEVAGGEHNETHWAARFDKVLLYLFGRPLDTP